MNLLRISTFPEGNHIAIDIYMTRFILIHNLPLQQRRIRRRVRLGGRRGWVLRRRRGRRHNGHRQGHPEWQRGAQGKDHDRAAAAPATSAQTPLRPRP